MTDDEMMSDLELLSKIKAKAEELQLMAYQLNSKNWFTNIWYCVNDVILQCNYARNDIQKRL